MPPPRVTAILAAAMLAVGMAVGAAVGPSPSSSLAGTADLPLLLRTLSALAAAGRAASAARRRRRPPRPPPSKPARPRPPARRPPPGPARPRKAPRHQAHRRRPAHRRRRRAPGGRADRQKALPAATSVWLIELSGEGFTAAEAQASAAPYITGQAIPSGTLLSSWSTLDAGALASEAALLSGEPPQTLETIVQPPCPEGAAGASCAPGTPGALSGGRRIPQADDRDDHRNGGLPRARADRRDVQLDPVGDGHRPPGRRRERDALIAAACGRARDLALCCRGRQFGGRVRPISPETEPRRAPARITDTPSNEDWRLPLHATRNSPPSRDLVARRDRGPACPAARGSGGEPR